MSITWSAKSRQQGGLNAAKKSDQIHVWLKGHPRAACGKRVSYIRGDDEFWTGDPQHSGCDKCLRKVGYTTHRPSWAPVVSRAKPMDKLLRGDTKTRERAAAKEKRRIRSSLGLCVSCGEPADGFYRCFSCRHRASRNKAKAREATQ